MAGIDARTGQPLDETADIVQSVHTILTTPIGTRVMRRGFGSHLFDLVDSPATPRGALRLIAAAADAIDRWETRVRFVSGAVVPAGDGRATLTVQLLVAATARPLSVPVAFGGA